MWRNYKNAVDGRNLFKDVTFSVSKNDKIAFLSKDPLAITYFFEIINGFRSKQIQVLMNGVLLLPKHICQWSITKNLLVPLTLMDWLRQFVPSHVTDADEPFISGFLGKMLFSGDDVMKKTNVLSGGEKVRCMVSKMMLQNPNVVVLDQPTNHLDWKVSKVSTKAVKISLELC